MKLRHLWTIVLVLTVLSFGMASGIVLDRAVLVAHAEPNTASGPNLGLISEAWNTIQKVYVDRPALDATRLTYGAIQGMVDALGDTGHSTFLTPQMLKQENSYMQGGFEGIGAEVEKKNDQVVIVAPFDDSPAERAGLKPGDVILKVNGDDITGLPLEQVIDRIIGPAGTSVKLTVLDPNTQETRDLTIVRARIVINNVTWQRVPGTTLAHVRVVGFSNGVSAELKKALSEIQQQNLTGVILDLRNNPGGLLDEAVGTTSQFLSSGNVLLEKDAQGRTQSIPVERGANATTLPLVVLINSGSASASEIVAGALQDAHRGTLVGETTFGTGTVLNQFPLSDGSALLLATQEWLTPKGRVIWHHGITPDVPVTLSSATKIVLPKAEESMTPSELSASGDTQLLKAVELLGSSATEYESYYSSRANRIW